MSTRRSDPASTGGNSVVPGVREWLDELRKWRGNESIHRRRLERALLSLPDVLDGDAERGVHSLSRLGIWARDLAADLEDGSVEVSDVADQLRKLGEAGDLAFDRWQDHDLPNKTGINTTRSDHQQ